MGFVLNIDTFTCFLLSIMAIFDTSTVKFGKEFNISCAENTEGSIPDCPLHPPFILIKFYHTNCK